MNKFISLSFQRKILIGLQLFVGLGAFPAGLFFVLKPDGSMMAIDASVYKYPLFSDFLIPGIVLT
ncbi:MAG: hypothetical protein CVT92_09135 [Bacteroidetes bacterium HGW-Bacteroidetes-1]|jgi:hypothetical protein|nr:MAG: hypothetical protein CVT92_09135 [Bacteroidetes bacterium HGW-Bacteroidetes-1]